MCKRDEAVSWPEVKPGVVGEVIFTAQYLLSDHDCDVNLDGCFDAQTEEAIKTFQIAKGLSETCVVDPATWPLLAIDLSVGAQRPDAVRALHRQLKRHLPKTSAFEDGDGVFGALTRSSVWCFQAGVCNLYRSGVVNARTWKALVAF